MNYHVFSPNDRLSKYIRCYWSLDNLDDLEPHSRERIFPDGCIEMIFNHGDLLSPTLKTEPKHNQKTLYTVS
ncbi:hypothetical protein H9W95_17235 [Flavobacterium lindanitolerans]|nr:hypothetical protein [Flavobacterium lindanitolerans]